MCKDCGCGLPGEIAIDGEPVLEHAHPDDHEHEHAHGHGHGHAHGHAHEPGHPHEHAHVHAHDDGHQHDHDHALGSRPSRRTIELEVDVLAKNDRLANENRERFRSLGLRVVNLLSSPGSGKTTLLERTGAFVTDPSRLGVIVGDLATEHDAVRLRAAGLRSVQITTGSVCHLDAAMIRHAADRLPLDELDVLIIENVGNLVCPGVYDLGEGARVVLLSVTEGEDKPLKYPPIFGSADLVVLTKMDLAVAVGFDREAALANVQGVAPRARIVELSARTGEGMEAWGDWILGGS